MWIYFTIQSRDENSNQPKTKLETQMQPKKKDAIEKRRKVIEYGCPSALTSFVYSPFIETLTTCVFRKTGQHHVMGRAVHRWLNAPSQEKTKREPNGHFSVLYGCFRLLLMLFFFWGWGLRAAPNSHVNFAYVYIRKSHDSFFFWREFRLIIQQHGHSDLTAPSSLCFVSQSGRRLSELTWSFDRSVMNLFCERDCLSAFSIACGYVLFLWSMRRHFKLHK